MIAVPVLLLAVTTGLVQSPPPAVELAAFAVSGSDSVLIERARSRPDDVRDAVRRLLADGSLPAAERLAGAWAVAWRDSFLLRQVARFRALSPAGRQLKVATDSLRLAANDALGRIGIEAAMRTWRESLRRAESASDTAGIAAALGNLGGGFYRSQLYDSAEVYLARSRDLALRIGDHRTAGNAIGALGAVSERRGDLRRASDLYARASQLRELTGDARGLAADQQNLGVIARELGDWPAARRAYESALAANRGAGRAEPAALNLVNLGNLASLEGEYAQAGARYREALAAYRALGNRTDAAAALHALGLLAIRRGDYPEAVTTLAEAARSYRRTGPAAEEIAVRRDLAGARAAAGDLQEARAELQRAEALIGARRSDALRAGLALARADLAVQFNQLREAERHYARAEHLARQTRDDHGRAAAQQGLGLVLLIRESYPGALSALELALRTQQGSADNRGAALTRLLIGYARRQLGDTAAAHRVVLQSLDALRELGDAAGEAAALAALGDLESRLGLPLAAESLYRRGLERLGRRPAPEIAWQLHAGLAGALRSRGALSDAAQELRAAIGQIERVSSGLVIEERRAAFLADKWDVYVDLAMIERTRGRVETAFEASERLRARQMLGLLARGRIGAADDASPELRSREQDLRRRVSELTRQLETTADNEPGVRGPPVGETAGALREALARSQEAYSDLLLEMRERQPEYAALVHADVAPARDVMRALRADEALLEYLVGDSTTIVFAVTSDTVIAIDLNVTREQLAELVDFARGTLAAPAPGAARRAWRAPLRRLFQYLVAPVETDGVLGGKRRLLIAPHGELHYIPFAALVRDGLRQQFLVERYVIEYVPSASVWLRLRSRPASPRGAGVLAFAPRVDALPGSRAEVAAIGRLHGGRAQVLTGAAASEGAFRALAPRHAIVHLATYGVLNKHNPLFSFVEMGAGTGDDGRLEVHEVFGLTLGARLLVLSACQTGLGAGAVADVPPGDDWVGLVQAFLFAGASNVMATLWPVADVATARLMERFYRELGSGRSEAEALAEMQRAAARDPATAHPFYWAGFAMVTGQ